MSTDGGKGKEYMIYVCVCVCVCVCVYLSLHTHKHIYLMEYYSPIKRNEILPLIATATRIYLEIIIILSD